MLAPLLPAQSGSWTENACLPGGDLFGPGPSNHSVLEYDKFMHAMQKRYGFLPHAVVARYARAYGTRIDMLLDGCNCVADMGEEIAPGLYEVEVDYLVRHEWAVNAVDILWRRSKLGLHLPRDTEDKLDAWIGNRNRTEKGRSARKAGSPH